MGILVFINAIRNRGRVRKASCANCRKNINGLRCASGGWNGSGSCTLWAPRNLQQLKMPTLDEVQLSVVDAQICDHGQVEVTVLVAFVYDYISQDYLKRNQG